MENLTLFSWSGILTLASSVFMAFMMLFKGRTKIHYIWTFFCLAVAIWGVGSIYIGTISTDKELSFLWFRIAHIGVILIPPAFLHFVIYYLDVKKKYLVYLGYFFALVYLYLNIVEKSLVSKIEYSFDEFFYNVSSTLLYGSFTIYFFILITISFIFLWFGQKEAKGVRKARIQYIFYGLGVSFLGGSLNFLPILGIKIYPYANFLTALYPLIVGYSILKYKLLDIELAFRELLKYILILVSTFLVLFGITSILESGLGIKVNLTLDSLLSLVGFIILFYFFNHVIRSFRWLDNFFSVSNFQLFKESLEEFIKKDIFYKSIKDFETDLNYVFCDKWRMKNLYIYKKDDLNRFSGVAKLLKKSKKILVKQELLEDENVSSCVTEMSENEDIFIPLFDWTGKSLLAILVFEKKSDESGFWASSFSKQEMDLIHRSMDHITLSFQVLHYSQNLRDEVDIKTKELQESKKELEISYEKLKMLDEAKDTFVSLASHELKTPMTTIRGHCEFLIRGTFGRITEKQAEYVSSIKGNAEYLLKMVGTMLNVGKIEAGKMDYKFETIDVKDELKKILKAFHVNCELETIKYSFEIDDKIPESFTTDSEKLRLILNNIVGNALKYTPKGKAINVAVKQITEKVLQFSVKDSGQGIPAEDLERIFGKFEQAGSYTQKTTKGSGLGLYMVKRVLKIMGGAIKVESEPGKGSDFIFTISEHDKEEEIKA